MKNILLTFFVFIGLGVWSQMSDSFDDGDFTNNPTWGGDVSDFIVNANLELQLNASAAGSSYLSTPHNLTQLEDKEWRYRVKYTFSPSNNNYGLTYLTATDADLSTNPDGVFFRIGENGSNDPIELKKRVGGVETTILTSAPGIVANSFDVRVKIIYRANGDWELYYDLSGGDNYILDVTANDPVSLVGSHIGVLANYTVTNSTRFYYDDFYAGEIYVDVIPPELDTVFATSTTELEVLFNESIEQTTGEEVTNYFVDKGIGNPVSVVQDPVNSALFHLTFSTPFDLGELYTLSVEQVEDIAGNTINPSNKTFMYIEAETPAFGDIIINEFMADENPPVGLPEYEYVEIYNRSNKYFHINGWKLSDNSSSGTIQDAWLYPGEYLVLVPTAALADFPQAIGVTSWAALNNGGDEIHLHSDDGILIDQLEYTIDWYKDEAKKEGGWSLERINPELLCSSEDNWRASVHPSGGTPGAQNSVLDLSPDITPPTVIETIVEDGNKLKIRFSEMMDSLSLMNATFSFSGNQNLVSRVVNGQYPTSMTLEFDEVFVAGTIYEFTLQYFSDCSGNSNDFTGSFLLPQAPQKGDLIINEILFNPLTGGSDFVEIYNRSSRYIDLKDWVFANYQNDTISNHKMIEVNYVLAPDAYVVVTRDTVSQLQNYPMAVPGKFIQISSLPNYNNDSSTVYLIYNDTVMDKVSYQENWHFSLLQSKKGVSLERFDAEQPSNLSSNWHSASETVGYATPGGRNSQAMTVTNEGGTLSLSSKTFSPDGDGFEDALLLTYEVNAPDLLGSIVVYDDKGRKIKTLLDRELLGGEGIVKWEGTKEDGTKASIGPYIIIFDIFDLNAAKVQSLRKVVTLAGRL